MGDIALEARNADLADIKAILDDQRARRLDVVVNAAAVSAMDAMLVVDQTVTAMDAEGVTKVAGQYRPTNICDEGLAAKLELPSHYLRWCRANRADLYDANVNGMLHGGSSACAPAPDYVYPGRSGKYLLRLLRGDEGQPGVARAFLSPKYRRMDNLDVLLAVLMGARDSGLDLQVGTCDLTERRMYVRLEAPQIAALAPNLLKGYRSPFDGPGGVERAGGDRPGMRLRAEQGGWTVPQALEAAAREGMGYAPGTEPIVWAGLVVSNSDTGGGARTIAPQIRVRVCKNGLTLVAEADRKVHLGGELAEGLVDASAATQEAELALIMSQTKDAVQAFLSQEFLDEQVGKIEALAGLPVGGGEATVKEVAKAAGFTNAEADGIFEHFLRGGQGTAGGVVNAVTSYAQTLASADRADEIERKSMVVLAHAARLG